jgi:putative glycosyltransferase
MMTGLAHARGDMVFLLDSDLEEDPELLQTFYEELQRSGADVVFGVQEKRKGSLFERISGSLYFKLRSDCPELNCFRWTPGEFLSGRSST